MGGDRDDDGGTTLSAQSDLLVRTTHKLDSYSNRESELNELERIRKMES